MNKLSKIIFLLIIILVCFGTALFSQAPNKFSYQAIVRNANNEILANTSIGIRISILHASPNGLISYQEAHTVTSNANGLINLVVGSGNILSGNMSTIVWHSSSYYIKTEIDPLGGTNYVLEGTSQLLSVPYALSSGDNLFLANGNNIYNKNSGAVGIGTNAPNSTLTVQSAGSPSNNGNGNTWITSSFGASSGSRLVLGTRNENPTIGATNEFHTVWDTLDINPGGQIKFGNYASSSSKILSTDNNGLVKHMSADNGLSIANDKIQLGGSLTANTGITLNQKQLKLIGGANSSQQTVVNNPISGNPYTSSFVGFGQTFTTTVTGTLNKMVVYVGTTIYDYGISYLIFSGEGYAGPIVASGLVSMPINVNFQNPVAVEIPLNISITANSVYTLKMTYSSIPGYTFITENNQYTEGVMIDNLTQMTMPNYDLRFSLFETEAPFDFLVFNGLNKSVNIGAGGNAMLNVNRLASPTWASASFGLASGGNKAILGNYNGKAAIGASDQSLSAADTLSINPLGPVMIPSLSGSGTRAVLVNANGTLLSSLSSNLVTQVNGASPIQIFGTSAAPMVSINQAGASANGYLSATDWNTFNNKQNALSNASTNTLGILTSTDWNTFNNKQNALSNASTNTSGILTSTDWNTFNNKQNALSNASVSTSGILTSTDWNTFNNKQNALSNASATVSGILSSSDWNIFNNKFNLPSLTSGSILFSNGSTIAQKNNALFWDNTNNALGIGTTTPNAGLHIQGYNWDNGFRISANNQVGPAVFLDGAQDYAMISTNAGSGAGSNKLALYDATAAQYRLVIDPSGAMGIGTTNPSAHLEVTGTAGIKATSNHIGSGYADWISGNFGGQGNTRVVLGVFDTIAAIGAHNTALDQWKNMAINPGGGNVGVGTTHPEYTLDVNGSQRVTGTLQATTIKQNVYSFSINVPGASYPFINFGGGSSTPTYGETTYTWTHNLGYNPVVMTSLDETYGNYLSHVSVSYKHVGLNTIVFYFRNTSVSNAQGNLNVIVVN